jgi:hypothetical protein
MININLILSQTVIFSVITLLCQFPELFMELYPQIPALVKAVLQKLAVTKVHKKFYVVYFSQNFPKKTADC